MIRCIALNFFGTVALPVFFLIGCNVVEKPKPSAIEVECAICDGDGLVVISPDHSIVRMGFDPSEYECMVCGGTGKLYRGKR